MPELSIQAKASQAVQSAFFKGFFWWGDIVGRKPKTVILVSFLFTILGSLRLIMAPSNPLPSETRQERLFAPQDSVGVRDHERFLATFGESARRTIVYITTQPRGGNVLTSAVFAEARRFDYIVTNNLYAYAYQPARRFVDVGNWSYNDLCVQSPMGPPADSDQPPCAYFSYPLEFFYRIPGTFDFDFTDAEIADIINSGRGIEPRLFPEAANRSLPVDSMFGGIVRDSSDRIVSATSITLSYMLQPGGGGGGRGSGGGGQNGQGGGNRVRNAAAAWEEQLNAFVGAEWTNDPPISRGAVTPDGYPTWSSDVVDIYPWTAGAITRELSTNIQGDLASLQISLFSIGIYAFFVMSKCRSPKNSHVLLSLAGVISAAMSIAVAYGFATWFVPVNQVVNVLPFILIGIGVDDMFVMVSALAAVPIDQPVPMRVAKAMAHAGTSITITSLTDFTAFALGTTSSLPALSGFCTFAAIGIAADFLLQITFFAGWMTLDARREAAEQNDCCCCTPCCAPCPAVCCPPPCARLPLLEDLNKRYYVPLLRMPAVKAVVVVAFVGWTAFSGYQATMLRQDFQRRWFVNMDATLQRAFDIQDDYYSETAGMPVSVATPAASSFDYRSIANQQKLIDLDSAIDANRWIEADSVSSWYPRFREWIHACGETVSFDEGPLAGTTCVRRDCTFGGRLLYAYCTHAKELRLPESSTVAEDSNGRAIPGAADVKYLVHADGSTAADATPLTTAQYIPPEHYWAWLDQWVADSPLGAISASGMMWVHSNAGNLTRAQAEDGLRATRVRATYIRLTESDDQIACMRDMRTSVESVDMPGSYPYMFQYIFYEQFAVIRVEAYLNLGLALVAVFIIVTLLVASVHASLMVLLCVVMVDINILGLMQMWGLTIDSVTIINLVLAIGLSVDYSAHVAHAFIVATGTRQERADHAIGEIGTAVIHGAMSTFVAVVILAASQSYIFRVFFQQFFGICIFGMAHGLVFLPVMLSLVGPEQIEVYVAGADEVSKSSTIGGKDGVHCTIGMENMDVEKTPPSKSAIDAAPAGEPIRV